jgi:PAS domain S-box-containing protein
METKDLNLLIIEDHDIFFDYLSKIILGIKNKRFNIIRATTLENAVDILKNFSFDLILSDLGLPDSEGINTIINIYSSANYTPIIALTHEEDYFLSLKAIEYGADDFILKGKINFEILEKTIDYTIERSKFKRQILKKDASIKKFIDNNKDGILIINKSDNIILYSNFASEHLLKADGNTLINKKLEIPFSMENFIEYKFNISGEEKIIEISTSTIEWNDISSYILTLRDITLNKIKENELKQREQTLKKVFESMLTGIILIDYNTKIIIDVNPIVEKIFGYKKEELIGQNCKKIICEHEPDKCIIEGNENTIMKKESFIINKDSVKIPVFKSSNIINITNKKYIICSIADLSEQKAMEELLKKKLEYERLESKITKRFFELDDIDNILKLSLDDIRKLTGSDISFVILFKPETQFEFNIYDSYSSNNYKREVKKITKDDFDLLQKTLNNPTPLLLPTFNNTDTQFKEIIDFSKNKNVESAVFIPLYEDNIFCGLMGIEFINKSQNWELLDIDILITISQMIVIGWNRFENINNIINNYILLNSIIHTIPGPIFYKNIDGTYLGCNDKFSNLFFGTTEEDIVGFKSSDIRDKFKPDFNDSYYEKDEELFKNPGIQVFETQIICKDGIARNFVFYKSSFKNAENQIAGIVGIMLDITSRKAKENEILKLNTAINQSENLVTITNKNGIIEYVNKGFKKVTGFNENEIIGKDFEKIMSVLNPKNIFENLQETIIKGNIWKGELLNIKKSGEIFYEWASITPVFDNYSQITNFIMVSEDITQRKQEDIEKEKIKQKLIESEKLSVIGQLSAGIAHEFNNILAIIKSTIQLMLLKNEMKQLELPGEVISELKTIEENIKRGSDIVGNLTNLSRPTELKQDFYQIKDIIDEVLKIQKKQFEIENIIIEKKYDEVPDLFIDRGQLHQVFLNLSINARHAMKIHGKGKITISIKKINTNIEIRFGDTGTGIKNNIKDKIFLPFFSTKGAHSKDGLDIKGTGLGLSVTLNIIKSNNGSIEVESEENNGATFIITFPINEKKVKEISNFKIETNEKADRHFNSFYKIVIVDDEEKILENMKSFLRINGYRNIMTFNNGNNFINSFKKEMYNLILLDFYMPGINGAQIFEKIVKIDDNIKVVFLTGNIEELENISIDKNIILILKKPFEEKEILKKIDELSVNKINTEN